jgi:hypothetical protein
MKTNSSTDGDWALPPAAAASGTSSSGGERGCHTFNLDKVECIASYAITQKIRTCCLMPAGEAAAAAAGEAAF